jgi:hypothetical protein
VAESSFRYREQRYLAEIVAELLHGQQRVLRSVTWNVSPRGAFILTDAPPPVRQLFRVRFFLPPSELPATFECLAAHAVPTPKEEDETRPPGIGVQLFGVAGVDGTRWQQFMRWLRAEHPESTTRSLRLHSLRSKPRASSGGIRLSFASLEEFYRVCQQDFAKHGFVLPLAGQLPPGRELELIFVHPRNQRTFSLRAIAKGNVGARTAIDFLDLSPAREKDFRDFVNQENSITIDVGLL